MLFHTNHFQHKEKLNVTSNEGQCKRLEIVKKAETVNNV